MGTERENFYTYEDLKKSLGYPDTIISTWHSMIKHPLILEPLPAMIMFYAPEDQPQIPADGLPAKKTYDLIVPGKFSDSPFTDLLFYDRESGTGEFYTTDGKGNISILQGYAGKWQKSWDMIIPGNFTPGPHTDLLFYDRTDKAGYFHATDGNGNISNLNKIEGVWSKVIPGSFGVRSEFTDLFLYDPSA